MYILRVSVIEIIKETARDLLQDRPPKIEFTDTSDSFLTSSTELEFSSIEEFKSVCWSFFTFSVHSLNIMQYYVILCNIIQ